METDSKDLYFADEESQPHHLHMFDNQSHEGTKYHVQNVATNVEALCYQQF